MHPLEVLERYWNFISFRPNQEEIINAVLEGEDTFVLLPTGGGKSICYQIPALIKEGLCIVVCPLIALMTDQVNALKEKGIKAIALTSGISHSDLDRLLDNCVYGNYKFLYLSPERLKQTLVRERISRMNVSLIAVDEAHCISQWGNDFRPAYKEISTLRQIIPHVNFIALTATAKPQVIGDIVSNLDMVNPKLFKASFIRPNISYLISKTEDKLFEVERLLNENKGSAIVYVRNRKLSEEISDYLNRKNISASFYHGGISSNEKKLKLDAWSKGQTEVMVATTAFGMGIDKADVRTVIHFNLPESLESYYQEAGRAGRDGLSARAVLLVKALDDRHLKSQFLSNLPDVKAVKLVYKKLCNYLQISYGEGQNTSYLLDFSKFCKAYDLSAGRTYQVLQVLDRNGIISLTEEFDYLSKVKFTVSNNHVFSYLEKHLEYNAIIKSLLRTYGGIYDFETKVNLNILSQKSNLNEKTVIQQLNQLDKDGIIQLEIASTDSKVTFLKPREDDITINPIAKLIEQQNQHKKEQINAVIAYVENNYRCKSNQLLDYFGETNTTKCGRCSVCLEGKAANRLEKDNLEQVILELLQKEELSSRQLLMKLKCDEGLLLEQIKLLVQNEIILITESNTYKLW